MSDFIRRDDVSGLYWCVACSQTTKERATLVRHVEAKHYSPGYLCQFCRKPYNAKYLLLRHINKYHRGQETSC